MSSHFVTPMPAGARPARAPKAVPAVIGRFRSIGLCLLALWLVGVLAGPVLAAFLGLEFLVPFHGHAPADNHRFADMRAWRGLSNAMDVLSNLPLALAGGLGLWVLGRRPVAVDTWQALLVFFGGLILTALGSAFYHHAPHATGLAFDRMGMAVTFAGVLSLAVAERVDRRLASQVLGLALFTALISAALPLTHGNVLPWVVVQFGGMALIAWAALQPAAPGALGVRLGAVIALYALAKVLEALDAGVFQATGGWISGHSLKHVVAALAAWPMISAVMAVHLRQNAGTAR